MEWSKRSVLPAPTRTSPPPSSAQKVHKIAESTRPPPVAPLIPATPAPATASRTITPATRISPPAPPNNNNTAAKAGTRRLLSPEIDVDGSGTSSDPDGYEDIGVEAGSDPRGAEIVAQLEKTLPRWPGFGEEGWITELKPVEDSLLNH